MFPVRTQNGARVTLEQVQGLQKYASNIHSRRAQVTSIFMHRRIGTGPTDIDVEEVEGCIEEIVGFLKEKSAGVPKADLDAVRGV